MEISLRPVGDGDLPLFFDWMSDPVAVHAAAFTSEDPTDRHAFDAHWARVLADPSVVMRSVLADGAVVGNAGVYGPPDDREVTYWIDRARWGRGVATAALAALLDAVPERPLYACRGRQRGVPAGAGEVRVHRDGQGPRLCERPRRGDGRAAVHPVRMRRRPSCCPS